MFNFGYAGAGAIGLGLLYQRGLLSLFGGKWVKCVQSISRAIIIVVQFLSLSNERQCFSRLIRGLGELPSESSRPLLEIVDLISRTSQKQSLGFSLT